MPTFSRAPGVLSEVIDDRALLVSADGGEVITLNPVGTLVWGALEQPHDLEGLVAFVSERFPKAPEGPRSVPTSRHSSIRCSPEGSSRRPSPVRRR